MRVLHISVTDKGNGAHLNGFRLHKGLRKLGVDSSMFVQQRLDDSGDETIHEYRSWPVSLLWRAKTRAFRYWISRELSQLRTRPNIPAFIYDRATGGDRAISQMPEADVIYIHGIYNFIDYFRDLPELAQRAPIVFRLCDMDFFTGGCTYARGCERFADRCGACPQLVSHGEDDISRRSWERKHAVFSRIHDRLHFVAPSDWIAAKARQSSLLRNLPIDVIPNSADTDVFRPRDQLGARALLDVPRNARVLLYVAQPVSRVEKGFAYLAEALQKMSDRRDLLLLVAGSGKLPAEVPIQCVQLGRIRDERLLSLVYSAADVFVMPSLEETFGMTAVEAMATGTPVVAFATGGIAETVRHGVTGLHVPTGSSGALCDSIEALLSDSSARARMAENGRRIAVEEYSMPVIAKRYADHCARIIGSPSSAREPVPVSENYTLAGKA